MIEVVYTTSPETETERVVRVATEVVYTTRERQREKEGGMIEVVYTTRDRDGKRR